MAGYIVFKDRKQVTPAEASRLADEHLSEDAWQAEVIRFLQGQGWRIHHSLKVRTSKGVRTPLAGDTGMTDILAARAGIVLFAELKTMSPKSVVKPEQCLWLNALSGGHYTAKEWGTFDETPVCLVRGNDGGPDVYVTVLRPCHRGWLFSNFTTIPGVMV